jgi:hypothetical protein
LDLQSAEDLLEEYDFLDISDVIGETEAIFWDSIRDINQILYTIYRLVVSKFETDTNAILEVWVDYEIYVNYMDNSLYFLKSEAEDSFYKWKKKRTGL